MKLKTDYFKRTNYIPGSVYNLQNNNTLKIHYMELKYNRIWNSAAEISEEYKNEVLEEINDLCFKNKYCGILINIIIHNEEFTISSFDPKTLNHQILFESYFNTD